MPMVLSALEGYDLVVAHDVEQAIRLIQEDGEIDAFVIGILFDDSQGMELIKTIRLDKNRKHIPILVTRFMPSQYEEMLAHVMGTMKALGSINEYFEADYNEASVKTRLRQLVEGYLPKEKICSTI